MNKQEYLKALEKRLKNLPREEVKKSLAFYAEIIDDRMEEGADEEEAVKSLRSPDEVAAEIFSDSSFASIVRGGADRVRSKYGKSPGFTVLLVLGFPLWFPLLIAAAALLFSGAIVFFSLWLSLFAAGIALLLSSVAGIFGAAVCFFRGDTALGVCLIGASLVVFALTMLLWGPMKKLLKGIWKLAGNWLKGIKRLFVNRKKEANA